MKILIVEDEQHIAEGLRFNLEAENFETEVANDGKTALEILENTRFDAIVLDVMLPEVNGFEVAKKLRLNEDFTPILMLTALNKPEQVLEGFEAGADDYLSKPFELAIFLARLNGLLRRREWFQKSSKSTKISEVFIVNNKQIDFANLELKTETETVKLTLMEAKLLRHLIENEGNAVSRKTILDEVWELRADTDTRAIDNFIVRLRRLLENEPNNPKILQTVRGIGYKFVKN
jgi:two-component system, OmpR family, alkaline phosphatase synthesis response regulator PhoP